MTTPKNGRGSFDYEGNDAYYYVQWRIDDDDLEVKIYLDAHLTKEVSDYLFEDVVATIENMAIDDYYHNL